MTNRSTIATLTLGLALIAPAHGVLSEGLVATHVAPPPHASAASHASATTHASATPHCYSDWAEASDVIRRESLVSVSTLHAKAKQRRLGDVVRVSLCSDAGQFTYKLLVREPLGRVTTLIVSATNPFEAK